MNLVARNLTIGLIFFAATGQASVFDGGEFSASKISEKTEFGFYGPDLAPNNLPQQEDRFAAAPVGKPLYVIGDDEKCYWANFSYSKNDKVLIVYYKSSVSNEHCIYQKNFNMTPAGYSISVKNGGECVPTFADLQGIKHDWSIKETGAPVSFSSCVGAQSYGDSTDKDRNIDLHALSQPESPVEAKPVTLREVAAVVKSEKIHSKRAPASAVTFPMALPAPVVVATQVTEAAKPKEEVKPKEVKYTGKEYTVQLHSYLTSVQAKKIIMALKEKGVTAFEVDGIVDGKKHYRVCSGLFSTSAAAAKAKTSLAKKANSSDSFVQHLSAYKISKAGHNQHRNTASAH